MDEKLYSNNDLENEWQKGYNFAMHEVSEQVKHIWAMLVPAMSELENFADEIGEE